MTPLALAPVIVAAATGAAPAPAPNEAATTKTAAYVVRLARASPPLFVIHATWPGGARLEMDTTRPGDLPELLEGGWPALVTRLRVADAAGQTLEVLPDGAAGWRLAQAHAGPLFAEYEVDTRLLAEQAWPAPREAVFTDEEIVSIVGRALFVTTDTTEAGSVTFELPAGWRPYAPWDGEDAAFRVRSVERLRENLVVLARSDPAVVEAAGFRWVVFPTGSWRPLEPEIRRVARAHARHFAELLALRGRETYLAVLLPMRDRGAESYRQSLALTFEDEPSPANQASWASLIGHEFFHHWNGWLLRGAEYAPSQWFQEGFTEYAANVSTVAAGLMTRAQFRDRLGEHVASYRRLATSLEDPGTHKGPPLYSGGALVAFTWDVLIREATDGSRDLGDFLRALSRRCAGGERPYVREDLVAALEETAGGDWTSFLDRHVRGTASLPLEETFARAGLRLREATDGTIVVEEDAAASPRAKRTGREIVAGR